jgi:DNA modification methylase
MAYSSQDTSKPAPSIRRNISTNAGLIEIQIQYRAMADIVLDSRNPRQHSQGQVNQIADSIREFGFVMPIVVDHASQVVIGHGRVLAARKLGMQRVPVVEIRHLSRAQLKALRIADNRLAQHSHWDERLLGENFLELKELELDFDLSITGFSLPEIDLALQKLDEGSIFGNKNEADVMTGVPVCRPGDVWQLGDHRVCCGDATSEHAFDELMKEERAHVVFIDPPHNVLIDGNISGKGQISHEELANGSGELSPELFTRLLTSCCALLAKYSGSGTIHFICMDWRHAEELMATGSGVYSELMNIAVWIKRDAGLGPLYRSQHELIFVFKSGTGRYTNNIQPGGQGRTRSDVWRYDSASARGRKGKNLPKPDPAAKPVELVMDALVDCSNRGEVVLDSFLGSGTTLLAAERTGRICRGIELDPLHVDMAIRRWQNSTGRDAVRLSDSKLFRDIEAEKGAGQ